MTATALPITVVLHVTIYDDQVTNTGKNLAERLTELCAEQGAKGIRRKLLQVIPSPQTNGVLAVFGTP